MALINCPECGRQISDRAPSCPGCGILKEDIQVMLAEQNAANSSMKEKKRSNNNNVLGPQETEEEFVCYPTISAISESERTQYNEKNKKKSRDTETTGKIGLEEDQFTRNTIKVGETIQFGAYAGMPIEWIVLNIEKNRALLLSKYIIEVGSYHSDLVSVKWEDCDLRTYLNHDFVHNAFSHEERKKIQIFVNENPDNEGYETFGGGRTSDLAFCLSIDEVNEYLLDGAFGVGAKPTEYAAQRARELFKQQTEGLQYLLREDTGEVKWWLRTPGENNQMAAIVSVNMCIERKKLFHTEYLKLPSNINESGTYVTDVAGIRPALWLRLE